MQSASIRSRLLLAFTIFSLLVIILGSNLTYSLVKGVLYSELDHFLRDKLKYQQIAAAQVNDRVIFRLSEPILDMLQDPKGKDFFQFRYVDNGREIFKSSFLPDDVNLPKVGFDQSDYYVGHDTEIQMIDFSVNSEVDQGKSNLSQVPIRCMGIVFETEPINSSEDETEQISPIKVHLVVAHNCTEIEQVLFNLRRNVLIFGIILSIFVLIIVTIIVSKSMKPVEIISNDIRAIEIDEINQILNVDKSPKELYPIVLRVNELVSRVRTAISNERNFTSNAAHELRNPLAALRTQIEVALSSSEVDEDTCELLSKMLNLQIHMERVVSSLLLLARLDSGSEKVKNVEIPLAVFIRKTWKPFFDLASEKNFSISWDMIESDISILNDPTLLGILLTNLFDNAVSHTPVGGKINISSSASNKGIRIKISNSNPGVTSGDIDLILSRFGRKDPLFDDSKGHSGIGLNICERIVKDHLGGKLDITVDDQWFTVFLSFPVEVILGNHYHV